jgi:hypothetical protein
MKAGIDWDAMVADGKVILAELEGEAEAVEIPQSEPLSETSTQPLPNLDTTSTKPRRNLHTTSPQPRRNLHTTAAKTHTRPISIISIGLGLSGDLSFCPSIPWYLVESASRVNASAVFQILWRQSVFAVARERLTEVPPFPVVLVPGNEAAACGLDRTTVTRQLERLASSGLIEFADEANGTGRTTRVRLRNSQAAAPDRLEQIAETLRQAGWSVQAPR